MRYRLTIALVTGIALGGCREPDAPLGNGRLFVDSDPQGARIFIDGDDTGQLTPDTITDIGGVRQVSAQLDLAGFTYGYSAEVLVQPNEVTTVSGPLMARCGQTGSASCISYFTFHTAADLRFSTLATGSLLSASNAEAGLTWPEPNGDDYSAGGAPIFGGRVTGGPVALHLYDPRNLGRPAYLAGRPGVERSQAGGILEITQVAWVVPPLDDQDLRVARGMEVRERIIANDAVPGVLLVEFRYRNISADPRYQQLDAGVPAAGFTYTDAYVGMALDPDIGSAEDDWVSYDASLDAVFTYDASFLESAFTSANAPGLVGLRVLRAPAGTTVALNTWEVQRDWAPGTTSQETGYGMISGTSVFEPDHPGTEIGYLPLAPGDMRIVATAGPVQLAPGDSASIVLAVAVAPPAAGTYTSGMQLAPGDPDDTTRPLYAVAAMLRERLAAAEALLSLLP